MKIRLANSGFLGGKQHRSGGFSLVELLAVVFILSVVALLAYFWLQSMFEKTSIVTCVSNIRQLDQAMLSYAAGNNNQLPRWNAGQPAVPGSNYEGIGQNENPPWARILIDAEYLPDKSRIFLCPSDKPGSGEKPSTISYSMNANVADHRLTEIRSPSKTIVLTERYGVVYVEKRGMVRVIRDLNSFLWAAMVGSEHVGSSHRGKASFAFADGHVEVLPYRGDPSGQFVPDNVTPSFAFWSVTN